MKSLFSIFQKGLRKTATTISRNVKGIFSDEKPWEESDYEDLEAALIAADFGVNTAIRIVDSIRDRYKQGLIHTTADILNVAKEDIKEVLSRNVRPVNFNKDGVTVILLVGVNGSGKTTTAGKCAYLWKQEGKKVMLAACDTFRAAAVEQLKLWGQRLDCPVISSSPGADPSSVAFDAVKAAEARNIDILLIDTAGRQHTKKGLMDELAKMTRSMNKAYQGAPHEVWLTIDASIGTNALIQAKEFLNTAHVTGLVLTKLDGTGKGGMVVAIQNEFKLPVFFAGLGEAPQDLQPFDPDFYVNAIFDETR